MKTHLTADPINELFDFASLERSIIIYVYGAEESIDDMVESLIVF